MELREDQRFAYIMTRSKDISSSQGTLGDYELGSVKLTVQMLWTYSLKRPF